MTLIRILQASTLSRFHPWGSAPVVPITDAAWRADRSRRRTAPGETPMKRLNARLNAASDS